MSSTPEEIAREWHGCSGDDCPAYKAVHSIKHPIFGVSSMSYHDLAHLAADLQDALAASEQRECSNCNWLTLQKQELEIKLEASERTLELIKGEAADAGKMMRRAVEQRDTSEQQLERLKQAVNQSADCLPECDSNAHAENCPSVNTAQWLIDLQAKLEERTRQRNESYLRGGELTDRITALRGRAFQAELALERMKDSIATIVAEYMVASVRPPDKIRGWIERLADLHGPTNP